MINGLVLCGGQSSRLGFDKSTINKEGKPIHKWWLEQLTPICNKIYISCNMQNFNQFDGCNKLIDQLANQGPLGGVTTLIHLDHEHPIFLVACDLVYIRDKDIKVLWNYRNQHKDATVFFNQQNRRVFPLFGIFECSLFPRLIEEFQNGHQSIINVLEKSECELIEQDEYFLRGINTPEDYNEYLSLKP